MAEPSFRTTDLMTLVFCKSLRNAGESSFASTVAVFALSWFSGNFTAFQTISQLANADTFTVTLMNGSCPLKKKKLN